MATRAQELADMPSTLNPASMAALVALMQPGMVFPAFRSTAPTGFLMLNGDTIGDSGTGATHADAEYEDLFTHLWDTLADGEAPVSGGRGASASADWDAGKTLTITDARGRTLIGSGTGPGLSSRTIGRSIGDEKHELVNAEMPSHTHTASVDSAGSHSHGNGSLAVPFAAGNESMGTGSNSAAGAFGSTQVTGTTASDGAHTHNVTVDSTGSGNGHNNMQPSLVANWMIKT